MLLGPSPGSWSSPTASNQEASCISTHTSLCSANSKSGIKERLGPVAVDRAPLCGGSSDIGHRGLYIFANEIDGIPKRVRCEMSVSMRGRCLRMPEQRADYR